MGLNSKGCPVKIPETERKKSFCQQDSGTFKTLRRQDFPVATPIDIKTSTEAPQARLSANWSVFETTVLTFSLAMVRNDVCGSNFFITAKQTCTTPYLQRKDCNVLTPDPTVPTK